MKIEHLDINNYKQFSDLKLDLTYPFGHEKYGEPLDKICIIGQSGTGKTNLLDIIKKSVVDFSDYPSYHPFSQFVGKKIDNRYIINEFKTEAGVSVETFFSEDESKIEFLLTEEDNHFKEDEKNYFVGIKNYFSVDDSEDDKLEMSEDDKVLVKKLCKMKDQLIIDEINEPKQPSLPGMGFNDLTQYKEMMRTRKTTGEKREEINRAIKSIKERYTPISKSLNRLKEKNFTDRYIVDINEEADDLWAVMQNRIANYQVERSDYISSLSNKLLAVEDYDKKSYQNDMKLWENENENILEKIADDINFILQKFNLELTKIDENQKSYSGLIIKDLSNDTVIEYDDLSTGTKNLLTTFIPLKIHKPKDSIVLIDEPEMSFYPDIQKQLVDLYENVGTNNQLIVATHSPLIASSFEPWEIVELKFDKNHQIYRELYYEGENHVDNYFLDPRLLTWTSILTDVFDLTEDSNFTFRERKLMEYASLKIEIKAMNDKNSSIAQNKIDKFKKLSGLLGLQN